MEKCLKKHPPEAKCYKMPEKITPHQAAGGGSGGFENPKNLGPQKSGPREYSLA